MVDPGSPLSVLTDRDLEEAVIGQIVIHKAWPFYSALGMNADHFWSNDHKQIINIASRLVSEGVSPDPVLLRKGGASAVAISQCLGNTVPLSEVNGKYMLDQLRELSRARKIYYACQELEQTLSLGSGSAKDVVNEHLVSVEKIVRESTDTGVVMDADAQHAAALHLAKTRHSAQRVWLGLEKLDSVIDGLTSGEVLGLAARPGIGKTLWMGRYMRSVMDYEMGALMFSLEMPTAQIVTRLIQPEWEWNRTKALDEMKANKPSVEEYREKFKNLHICDSAGLPVAEMESITMRLQQRHKIGLVLIDHLGLVGGHNNLRPYERTSVNSREIKDLAKRCKVPVVVALQVSRESGGDGSVPLSLSSTRDSGVTEEVCDYLIGLHRPDRNNNLTSTQRFEFSNVVIARVIKNRHGAVGEEVAVHIDPETLEWDERKDLKSPRRTVRTSS